MAPKILHRSTGWYPQISPDGHHVAYQHGPDVWLVSLTTGLRIAVFSNGRAPCWPGMDRLTFWREEGLDAQHRPMWSRWEAVAPVWTPQQVEDAANGIGGSNNAARDGHVAVTSSNRWCRLDGQLLNTPYLPYGARLMLNGQFLVLAEDTQPHTTLHIYDTETRQKVNVYVLPKDAPEWAVSQTGDIGYGYSGVARAILDGVDKDVTITPWEKEGCPIPVPTPQAEWLWRATEEPGTNRKLVIGHPVEDKTVQTLSMEAAILHVIYDELDNRFIVAGNGPTGILTVIEAPISDARHELEMPPAIPPHIPRINRPIWLWYFKAWSNTTNDAGPDYPTYPGLPMSASHVEERHQLTEATGQILPSWNLAKWLKPYKSRIVALMCHSDSVAGLSKQGKACRAAFPRLKTLGICDFPMTSIPKIPNIDQIGIEVYPLRGTQEPVAATEARIARLLHTSPYKKVHLIQVAYDQNGTIDYQRLLDHQAVCARLAIRFPIIIGIGIFAANRADGMRKYPELITYHRELAAGIPSMEELT